MSDQIRSDVVYAPSDDIVAREIEGELLIVPLVSGIGDMEDELYSFNESGKAIWSCFDGQKTLEEVISALEREFDASPGEVRTDVEGLVAELIKRKMLVEIG